MGYVYYKVVYGQLFLEWWYASSVAVDGSVLRNIDAFSREVAFKIVCFPFENRFIMKGTCSFLLEKTYFQKGLGMQLSKAVKLKKSYLSWWKRKKSLRSVHLYEWIFDPVHDKTYN